MHSTIEITVEEANIYINKNLKSSLKQEYGC